MTKNELRKQWSDRIAAYKASGLTQAAFCEAQGVSTRQLSYWLRKETMQQISPEKTTRWLPVKLIDQGSTSGDNSLHIKLGPAIVEVRPGFDQKLLLDVLKTLGTLC